MVLVSKRRQLTGSSDTSNIEGYATNLAILLSSHQQEPGFRTGVSGASYFTITHIEVSKDVSSASTAVSDRKEEQMYREMESAAVSC